MSVSKILLFNGLKRSGKDFTAKMTKEKLEELGYSVEIMSFAGALKEIVAELFGISLDDLDTFKNEPENFKVKIVNSQDDILMTHELDFRDILQRLGTNILKKHFGENIWVDIIIEKIEESTSDFILIPDFRFKCEELYHSITIKVTNKEIEPTDTHISENELNDFVFNYEIDNSYYRDIGDDINKLVIEILSK